MIAHINNLRLACRASMASLSWLQTIPSGVAQLILEPALTAAFFLVLSGDHPTWDYGNALAAASMACAIKTVSTTTSLFAQDRYEGTLPYLAINTGGLTTVFFARIITSVAIGLISGISSICTVALISGGLKEIPCELSSVALIMMCCVLAATATGYAIHSLSLAFTDELLISNIMLFVLPLVSGSVASIWVFPKPLPYLFRLIPISSVTELSRLLATGLNADFSTTLLGCLLLSLAWFALGSIGWALGIKNQIRTGRVDILGL